MKRLSILFFAWAFWVSSARSEEDPSLVEAKTLFPEFRNNLYKDPNKADKAFERFLTMPKPVQDKMLGWLDSEFEKQKDRYRDAQSGESDAFGSRSTGNVSSNAESVRVLQEKIEAIRELTDEDKMKKELKSSGWDTLTKLLRITRRASGDSPKLPDPKKVAAAKSGAETVGNYRFKLRSKMLVHVLPVEEELAKITKDTGSAEEEIATANQIKSIADANEAMRKKIPKKEFEGILELNRWRVACGLGPLTVDPKLCDAARDHSKDMANQGFFAHVSPVPGKKTHSDRARNFGTKARGENIAVNNSVSAANQAWFYSPGHFKNMFRPQYSVIGLGIHGRHYTQMFR